jgi:hypothetical protein
MTKTRSVLDKVKLYYEKLPSDGAMDARVRTQKREARAKQRREIKAIHTWIASSPKLVVKLATQLRKGK